jgi:hypothetical protein
MTTDKLNISVENFGLSHQAKKRVQTALHEALAKELKAIGHPTAAGGVFGDGSVKGGVADVARETREER